MCLHCPDCGCNMKTNLCEVALYLCSSVERSTTQAANRRESRLRSNHGPKQRLVLPLVERADHDTIFPFIHTIHHLFYCFGSVSLLAKNLTHCRQKVLSLYSLHQVSKPTFYYLFIFFFLERSFPKFWTKSY